jgi:hypothetical protein
MKPDNRLTLILLAGMLICSILACNYIDKITISPTNTPVPASTTSFADLSPTMPLPASPTPSAANTPASTSPEPPSPTPVSILTPTTQPGTSKEYAVVLVKEDDVLNVRKAAGVNQPILGKLAYNAAGIALTGKEQWVGDDRWVEVRHAQAGTGWVNAYYLTEYVSAAQFCADNQVNILLDNLRRAVTTSDGNLFASIITPIHGLSLHYFRTGNVANYSPEEAKWVFQSDYSMNWGTHPASGLEVRGTFREVVLPTIIETFESGPTLECNAPDLGGGNYIYTWPAEYATINYYRVYKPGTPGVDLDWRTYLVGVEYVNGKPFLFALIHTFWEP